MADESSNPSEARANEPRDHGVADAGMHRQQRTTRGDFDNRLSLASSEDQLGPRSRQQPSEPQPPQAPGPTGQEEGARTRPREADRVGHPSVWGGSGRTARRGAVGTNAADVRIQDDLCERLAQLPDVDPTEVMVSVQDGRVTLDGTIPADYMQPRIADLANDIEGVVQVDNRVRVQLAPEEPFRTPGEQGNRHF